MNTDDLKLNDWDEIAQSFDIRLSTNYLNDLVKAAGFNLALMEKVFSLVRGNSEM